MTKLKLYFHFYKTRFLAPLALSLFALFRYKEMFYGLAALILASLLVWFYQRFIDDRKKQKLYFYYNLGLSELKLYGFVFCINLIILVSSNIYLK